MDKPHNRNENEPEPGVVAPVLDPGMLDPIESVEIDASNNPEPRAHPGEVIPRAGRDDTLRTGRLAGLSLNAAIITLAWPVLCESLLNSLIGLVDAVIAARISQAAGDAVGGAAYLLWFVGLIVMAIGVGATALISRCVGAGKGAVARAAMGQAILLAIVGGLGIAGVMWFVAPWMAGLMSMDGAAKGDFVTYMRAMCLGMPASTVLFASLACARGAGDTLRPLFTMITVNVVNGAAAWLLAIHFNLGVLGIGLGTSIAQIVGAATILWFHYRGASGVALTRRWLRPHRVTAYRLLRLGLPSFAETFGMWVVNFATVLMVGWMGHAAMLASAPANGDSGGYTGAHLLAIRLEAFSFLPGFSMGIAAGALCGQYLGAGLPHMARRAAVRCMLLAMGIMGTGGVVLIALGGPITRALSDQPAHLQLVPDLLRISGFIQVPFAMAIVMRSSMQGAGDVKAVMKLTWISQWGLRLPLAYAISGVDIPLPEWLLGGVVIENPFPFDLGLPGLWIGLCVEIAIRSCLYGWRFRSGQWLKARV